MRTTVLKDNTGSVWNMNTVTVSRRIKGINYVAYNLTGILA